MLNQSWCDGAPGSDCRIANNLLMSEPLMVHTSPILAYKLSLALVPKPAGLSHPIAGWMSVSPSHMTTLPESGCDSVQAGELGEEEGDGCLR